ncbi:MAG: large subunit ribosomal protein L3 [Alphaproteobacteria bacterium]|jgi:large subunit ribosomal protein L3
MSLTLVGKKLGMTRLFEDNGNSRAVTVLSLFDLIVIGFRTVEKNGYNAIIVGYETVAERKIKKPQLEFYKQNNLPLLKNQFEIRLDNITDFEMGKTLSFDELTGIAKVNVIGRSIGKGFAGAMKRHNFGGLRASHGVSVSHRSHGSTGACQDPGRVFKGKKMAGHLGDARVTVKNLPLVRFDAEKKLLFVGGGIPGSKNSHIKINY